MRKSPILIICHYSSIPAATRIFKRLAVSLFLTKLRLGYRPFLPEGACWSYPDWIINMLCFPASEAEKEERKNNLIHWDTGGYITWRGRILYCCENCECAQNKTKSMKTNCTLIKTNTSGENSDFLSVLFWWRNETLRIHRNKKAYPELPLACFHWVSQQTLYLNAWTSNYQGQLCHILLLCAALPAHKEALSVQNQLLGAPFY